MLKRNVYSLVVLALFLPLCQRRVDTQKEEQAIRAVIEAEKKGFFDKSLEEMAATWVQKPSSVKMYMSRDGELDLFGWSKMDDQSKEGLARLDSTRTNIRLEFSDYQFHIYETSAWAIFKANWQWSRGGQEEHQQQTRIMAFEKVGGNWKITLMAIYNVPSEAPEGAAKAKQ